VQDLSMVKKYLSKNQHINLVEFELDLTKVLEDVFKIFSC